MNIVTTNHPPILAHNLLGANFDNGNNFTSHIKPGTRPLAYQSLTSISKSIQPSTPIQNLAQTDLFDMEVPEFDCDFKLEIVDIDWSLSSNSIILSLKLNENIFLTATLKGHWKTQRKPQFYLESFGLHLDQKDETPHDVFLSSTIGAMLSLSKEVKIQIADWGYNFMVSFQLHLEEIRKLLKKRQIAYRLMVIEKALNVQLSFPRDKITGEEEETIAYCYHSIAERKFDWLWSVAACPLTAIEKNLSVISEQNEPREIRCSYTAIIKNLFGWELNLGRHIGTIDQALIENYEEAKRELSKLDGSIVYLQVRSLSGLIKIEAIETPYLPSIPWNEKIQKLVDLENQLDSVFLDKYFSLIPSPFEGLTDVQKQALTERPELGKDAFNF